MWNWLVGGLATGSSIFLFDGAPVYPKIDILLEYCQNKKINLFGLEDMLAYYQESLGYL